MTLPPQISLRRGKTFADLLRAYDVLIDGVVVGQVRHGEVVTFSVTPGRHTLALRIDWCGSEEITFDVSSNEHLTFDCGSSLAGWRILLVFVYVFLRPRQYLWIRRFT